MSRSVFAFALVVCIPSAAAADSGEFGAAARVRGQPMAAVHGEDPTAAGTSIDVHARVAVPRSLGELVLETPGARVQRTGALGAFSSIGLRGGDGEEVLVLLDDIPLVAPDGGPFDLSLFPAELFERVDVFRGGAPVWLGASAIGGVVRLVPRRSDSPAFGLSAGAGSFGAYQLEAGTSAGRDNHVALRSRAIVRGATDDFVYEDDKGTLFDPSDDETLRRKNAQSVDATGFADLTLPWLGGTLRAVVLANGRVAGEPGPGSQPTPNIDRSRTRGLVGAAYDRKAGQARLQLVAAASFAADRFSDRFGELGTSGRWETDDHAFRTFLRGATTVQLARWLETTAVGSYALDHYAPHDRFTFPAPAGSTRHSGAAALELRAHAAVGGIAVELRPSARFELSHAALHATRTIRGPFEPVRTFAIPTARLGVGVAPWPALALTASIASGSRLPSMFELFGDRGLVLPSPQLEPVRALNYDAGATLRHDGEVLAGALELRGFSQARRDAISVVRTAQWQLRHENVARVRQEGLELGARGALFDVVALHGALTYSRAQDVADRRLPFRPRWSAFVRPELRVRFARPAITSAGASAEIEYHGFAFADRANLAVVPACTTAALSASLGLLRDRLILTARGTDVTDARCTDLVGYPLPGRSLFFTLTWKENDHDPV